MTTLAEVEQAFALVPHPTFAVDIDIQEDGSSSYRVLHGRDRVVGPITVGTTAVQYLDGRIDTAEDAPQVWIENAGFSTDTARQLATALIAAADELDKVVAAR